MKEEDKKTEKIEDDKEEEIIEFEFNEDGEEDFKKTIKKLREDIKILKKEKEEYLNGWQKERADFSNYKKQDEERRMYSLEVNKEAILSNFLSVLDSFNMAFSNKDSWNKVDENWRKGVEYIYTHLNNVFEEYGIKEIGVVGETFNHNIHQSIGLTETKNKEDDHKISEIIQKGYKMGEKVIRAARVNVFEYKE